MLASTRSSLDLRIVEGGLEQPPVQALLQLHLDALVQLSPAGSVHAFDCARLRDPGITFWGAWHGSQLAGCAALRALDPRSGELKSMRTVSAYLRHGVARKLLTHVIELACVRGYSSLYLETGTSAEFAPAHLLYEATGFVDCPPFASYKPGPHSRFMRRQLP